jgi:hypothetical protein
MKKFNFRGIVLFVFVIGFPLISWYYLKRGIDFRVDRLASVSQKIPVPVDSCSLADGDTLVFRQDTSVSRRHRFLFTCGNTAYDEVIKDLQVQFTGIPNFQFVLLQQAETASSTRSLFDSVIADPVAVSLLQEFFATSTGNLSNRIYLIDALGNFRQSYPLSDKDSVVLFVQEAATLLPVKSGQELRFKRKQEI